MIVILHLKKSNTLLLAYKIWLFGETNFNFQLQGFREKYHKDEEMSSDRFYSKHHKDGQYEVYGAKIAKHAAHQGSKNVGGTSKVRK